jgi:hypothetical protein
MRWFSEESIRSFIQDSAVFDYTPSHVVIANPLHFLDLMAIEFGLSDEMANDLGELFIRAEFKDKDSAIESLTKSLSLLLGSPEQHLPEGGL